MATFLIVVAAFIIGSNQAHAQSGSLTLINGWTGYPGSQATLELDLADNLVHLTGAISSGNSPQPFVLRPAERPATDVYVPVDLCNATNGRLHITPSGAVDIQAEGGMFSNATCFTSLEGVSFAPTNSGFTDLTLINGWTNAPFSTSNAQIKNINGIVHFKGAIAAANGAPLQPFVMPIGFRPATDVYVPVDLCNATNGRLHITPSGTVDIQVEGGVAGNATCFTSLDGAFFALTSNGFTPLQLINGWTNAPFSTSNASFQVINTNSTVVFKGAIAAAAGSLLQPFVLPVEARPPNTVWVPVDLCNATKGRLVIAPSGVVTIQAENGAAGNATCFTSLDGVGYTFGIFIP